MQNRRALLIVGSRFSHNIKSKYTRRDDESISSTSPFDGPWYYRAFVLCRSSNSALVISCGREFRNFVSNETELEIDRESEKSSDDSMNSFGQ